jgi:hypothetical protein
MLRAMLYPLIANIRMTVGPDGAWSSMAERPMHPNHPEIFAIFRQSRI